MAFIAFPPPHAFIRKHGFLEGRFHDGAELCAKASSTWFTALAGGCYHPEHACRFWNSWCTTVVGSNYAEVCVLCCARVHSIVLSALAPHRLTAQPNLPPPNPKDLQQQASNPPGHALREPARGPCCLPGWARHPPSTTVSRCVTACTAPLHGRLLGSWRLRAACTWMVLGLLAHHAQPVTRAD